MTTLKPDYAFDDSEFLSRHRYRSRLCSGSLLFAIHRPDLYFLYLQTVHFSTARLNFLIVQIVQIVHLPSLNCTDFAPLQLAKALSRRRSCDVRYS